MADGVIEDGGIPSLETHVALERLVTELVWRVDHGRPDIDELFVPDGLIDLPGHRNSGRVAIREYGEQRAAQGATRTSRHHVGTFRFRMTGPDRAVGTAVAVIYMHDGPGTGRPAPRAVGEFQDEFLRMDGAWLFSSHRMDIVFVEGVMPPRESAD